jgi:hypothetical protein
MADILQDLSDKCAAYEDGILEDMTVQETYILLSRAVAEIERLRQVNSDMGWQLNPDRMGGQFTEEEKSRDGWL